MAISIISGNLNTLGNNGQFETDMSTWGFSSFDIMTRDTAHKTAGLYGCKLNIQSGFSGFSLGRAIIPCRAFLEVGKKYIASCKVYTPSAAPVAADNCIASIVSTTFDLLTVISSITPVVASFKNVFQSVVIQFTLDNSNPFLPATTGNKDLALFISSPDFLGGFNFPGGLLYADQFEIYEYVDVDHPCTLEIDIPGCVIVNESSPGASDGSMAIATTGGSGPLEYSKDGGTSWQLGNQWTGLSVGIYNVVVREIDITCNASQTFAINSTGYTFDFTTLATDETLYSAHDGTILVTVTGTTGPFTFSKDGGVSYQLSNSFTGLAPGTYVIVVKDASNIARAKSVTIAQSIATFDKVFHLKNPIVFSKSAPSGWESLTNFRLYCDVRVEEVSGSGIFVSKLKQELPPNTSGNVDFYIRQALRGVLVAIPPSLNQSAIVRLTDRLKSFQVFSGQLQDIETTPGVLEQSYPSLCIMGGINKQSYPDLHYFTSYLQVHKKFLTWAPIEKTVDRLQEDYLNFFVYSLHTRSLKLNIKAYYDDGSNATQIIDTITPVAYGQLYQVPAGPANSGVATINPAKNLVQYELSLLDQFNSLISEVRVFKIAFIRHPLTKFFMALNSLGSYEVYRFHGQAEFKTDFNREVVQKFLPANYVAEDGEFGVNNVSMLEKANYSTGFFKGQYALAWQRYMKDFMLSTRIFEVTTGKRIPVCIVSNNLDGGTDQDFLRFARIDVQRTFVDEVYTPDDI